MFEEDGYMWFGVSDVVKSECELQVFDLTVEEDHTYCTPTAIVHNSPEECVLLCGKGKWKKSSRGVSTMTRDEFMEAVKGVWPYRAETHNKKNPAPFSLDLPIRAINILTYKDDVVLDPFCGRGTTGAACKILDRKFIGIDISQKYIDVARDEITRIASAHDIKRFFEFLGAQGTIFRDSRESKEFARYITGNVELIKPICEFIRGVNEEFKDMRSDMRFLIKYTYDPECSDLNHWSFIVQFPEYASNDVPGQLDVMDRVDNIRGNIDMYTESGGDILATHDYDAEKPVTNGYLPDISDYS